MLMKPFSFHMPDDGSDMKTSLLNVKGVCVSPSASGVFISFSPYTEKRLYAGSLK